MSMNILITAERKVTFKKKDGKRSGSVQTVEFNAIQTPTRVTKQILASKDPAQTYIDWVLAECSQDRILPVFAEDDIWQVGEPVGTEIWNPGKEHVEEFKAWIAEVEENGFTVKFEMI
jgi:hypothetical protein